MLRIKRLYTFILETFLPLFLATFGVCLFIVLMQFLWKYVDDMVGKGLELSIIGQMFFYAALSLVPMALPLAILLASLMTFGNLGEKFELLAMKASGISLLKIMRPIIFLMIFVSIGAFFFQNNVLPPVQVKLWTLVRSMRMKSPELDIPEKTFYKDIPGRNIYVDSKDKKSGTLHDIMIYDFSDGFDNLKVIVADSGKLKSSLDKQHLIFTIYDGESFENLKKQSTRNRNEKIPYRRENFTQKDILIEFDANFKMADEGFMQGRDMTKDIRELRLYIDSVSVEADSLDNLVVFSLRKNTYSQILNKTEPKENETHILPDTLPVPDFYEYYNNKSLDQQLSVANKAKGKVENLKNEYTYSRITQKDRQSSLNGHRVELHRKYTLSFACLVFLFIGAPLGAIIRKGGLGMPAVISVFLFLAYYSIDIFGVKLAKQGVVPAWAGMWFSSFVLFSLGMFFTYKAVKDSAMFNPDTWTGILKRLVGKKEARNYQRKEVIMENPHYESDLNLMDFLSKRCNEFLKKHKKPTGYFQFWKNKSIQTLIQDVNKDMDVIIEDLRNSDENYIIGKLMDYPVINYYQLPFMKNEKIRKVCMWVFPIGLLFYFTGLYKEKLIKQDLLTIIRVNNELSAEIEKKLTATSVA